MSEWNDIESDNISVDRETKQINIWVKQDDWGSVYAVLTFDQLEEIYREAHLEKETT